jgi:hypothetical protein
LDLLESSVGLSASMTVKLASNWETMGYRKERSASTLGSSVNKRATSASRKDLLESRKERWANSSDSSVSSSDSWETREPGS